MQKDAAGTGRWDRDSGAGLVDAWGRALYMGALVHAAECAHVYEIPTVKEELALLQLYYTALLEARPEIERSYSFDELLADFQLVSIARLIYHIIDYANPRKVAEVEVEEAEEYVQV